MEALSFILVGRGRISNIARECIHCQSKPLCCCSAPVTQPRQIAAACTPPPGSTSALTTDSARISSSASICSTGCPMKRKNRSEEREKQQPPHDWHPPAALPAANGKIWVMRSQEKEHRGRKNFFDPHNHILTNLLRITAHFERRWEANVTTH